MDLICTLILIFYASFIDPNKNLYFSLYASYMDPCIDPFIGKSLDFLTKSKHFQKTLNFLWKLNTLQTNQLSLMRESKLNM